MIEFKAECGHTVRAKDENAGGVVRCSYCGVEAPVPNDGADDLDFLFRDIDQADEAGAPARRGKRKRGRGLFSRKRRARPLDPFAVILKLCYAALLISVIIVVGQKFVRPWFEEDGLARRITKVREQRGSTDRRAAKKDRSREARPGLVDRDKLKGLYVSSTPPGATGFYLDASRAPDVGRIQSVKGCVQFDVGSPSGASRASDGTFVVEVVFPLNDPRLKDYLGYRPFRRSIAQGNKEDRKRLVNRYFLPDGAADVFIDETDDQIYIVRQYRNVTVRSGVTRGVQALFLPRIPRADGQAFSIAELIAADYIPPGEAFTFDEVNVRDELDYYGVTTADQPFVLQALYRIGVIPYYVEAEKQMRLLRIGIHKGRFTAKIIREAS